jgi:Cof subfamily protein (haloacid dehalogenase superfamily)
MKTLYLSDLDGTLLRSDERVSEYSADVINRFVKDGGYFSYATARSIVTASKVTIGLDMNVPVICHNGVFIIDSSTHEIMLSSFFAPDEVEYVATLLSTRKVYPIVYAYVDGKERFSYIERDFTPAMRHFLDSRIGDPRRYEVDNVDELYTGDVFYVTCIDTEESLSQINRIISSDDRFNSIYQKDIYTGAHWCEILPVEATKANAALQLKAMLGCDKLVVFGDNLNDLSMFSVADESYAVANAVPELLDAATGVIDSNDDDGVARWLEEIDSIHQFFH